MSISKKDVEVHYFERFKALLPDFPQGVVTSSEEPDFLVTRQGSTVGIELTELHREAPAGTTPQQASEAMRHRVVARAQELYTAAGHPLVRATVLMNGRHIKRKDVETLAIAITDIAKRNIPEPNSSSHESYDWTNRSYFPEILDSVAVHRLDAITENFFSCPGSTWVASLSSADIDRALVAKESKYSAYRTRCDTAWLLINADIGPMSTWFQFDAAALTVPFVSSFDRVFVLRHFGSELYELNLTQ